MSQTIVDLKDVTKVYEQGAYKVHALRGLDLQVEAGDFIAVVGPSGSGKTTLFNIIGALDTPTSGHVRVSGEDLENLTRTDMARLRLHKIGFVFQAYNLVPVLTAYENTELVLALQHVSTVERKKRAMEILDQVGLKGMEFRKPFELSGGQQQRVAVARAMVARPDLILADEPTANLDTTTGGALMDMMRELNEKHKITFLMATHDPLVMERARRVIQIVDGKIAADERKNGGDPSMIRVTGIETKAGEDAPIDLVEEDEKKAE